MIPVTFTYREKQYKGYLAKISGAGTLYHLYVKSFYQGQLIKSERGWQFSTQKQGVIEELSLLLGKAVEDAEK